VCERERERERERKRQREIGEQAYMQAHEPTHLLFLLKYRRLLVNSVISKTGWLLKHLEALTKFMFWNSSWMY
jgi:hypothetical protein